MDLAEKIAIRNDVTKLQELFNPRYVSIYKRPDDKNFSLRLKIVVKAPTYVMTPTSSSPQRRSQISFFIDIYPGYPQTKPAVYYGDDEWLYHVNVFVTNHHAQCTDRWIEGDSSLAELAKKTVNAIVFNPDVCRYNSKANSAPEKWQRRMEETHKFPTMNPALLFRAGLNRTAHSV